jgi:ribosome-associated translation inhibitor RaiA
MIIQLDWFSCQPSSSWSAQIHQTLQELSTVKHVDRAHVGVSLNEESSSRFHFNLHLAMPGPDVRVEARGQTFDEALRKATLAARKTLAQRAAKSRQRTGAKTGVKPQHRG